MGWEGFMCVFPSLVNTSAISRCTPYDGLRKHKFMCVFASFINTYIQIVQINTLINAIHQYNF